MKDQCKEMFSRCNCCNLSCFLLFYFSKKTNINKLKWTEYLTMYIDQKSFICSVFFVRRFHFEAVT